MLCRVRKMLQNGKGLKMLARGLIIFFLVCAFPVISGGQEFSGGKEIYTTNYPDGKLKTVCEYKAGVLDGSCKTYDKSGRLFLVNLYNKKIRTGCTMFFESGKVKRAYTFSNGKMHGPATGYYESGKVHFKLPYENGQIAGLLNEYYENGMLKSEVNYKDGKAHGPMRQYHESGKLRFETMYNNGEVVGAWSEFDEDGNLIEVKSDDDSGITF